MSIAEEFPSHALLLGSQARHDADRAQDRPRGRPPLASRETVLETIRQLAARDDGLFRVHRQYPDLYARARRMFGSWSRAVALAGLDYGVAIEAARQRSLRTRRARASRVANRGR